MARARTQHTGRLTVGRTHMRVCALHGRAEGERRAHKRECATQASTSRQNVRSWGARTICVCALHVKAEGGGARHNTPHYSRCSEDPDEPLVRARCASASVGESEWRMAAAGAPTGSELAREKTLNFTRFKLWDGQRLRESVKEWRREENNTHRNESECTKSWLNACHCRVYIPQRPVVAGERGRFVTSPSVMISAPRKEKS